MIIIDKQQLEHACDNTNFLKPENFGRELPFDDEFVNYFGINNTLYVKGERVGVRMTNNNTLVIIGEVTNR